MRSSALLLLILVAGCPKPVTTFRGSAKVEGPSQCQAICGSWGMDLAGMVAMGDYSNGCICRVRTQPATDVTDAAAIMAAVSGVEMVRQRMAAQGTHRQPTAPRK